MGICELLTVAFVVLKLTGTIAWSWWWVISPMYPAVLLYGGLFLILGGSFFVQIWDIFRSNKEER